MARNFILIAALLGITGVALGAFGAHGLESALEENDRVGTFDTATQYHLVHAVAMLGIAWLAGSYRDRWFVRGGALIALGTIIFSGSLYILAVADLGIMGAVAPIGGTALIAGWGCVAIGAWRITDD